MTKSELIARCLMQARIVKNVRGGQNIVYQVLRRDYPQIIPQQWDREVPEWIEKRVLERYEGAGRVPVGWLIEQLSE